MSEAVSVLISGADGQDEIAAAVMALFDDIKSQRTGGGVDFYPASTWAVPREDLMLDYTVIEGSEVIATGAHALEPGVEQQFRRARANLVTACV